MPVRVDIGGERWLKPVTEWKKEKLSKDANPVLVVDRNFYILVKNSGPNP
jgi:hypothetical protein